MRIIHVIPYYFPARFGGPITAAHEIAKALVERGHEVQVFTTNAIDQNNFPSRFKEEELIDGIRVRRFRTHGKFMSYFFAPKMLASLGREHFDIIHAHEYRNFQTDIAALISLLKRKPLLVSLHGAGIKDVASKLGFGEAQWIYDAYDLITANFALRVAKVLLVHSQFEYESTSKFRKKIEVIPLGIDCDKYGYEGKSGFMQRYGIGEEKIVLFVGRLSMGKNLETLIRGFERVLRRHVAKLVIAGDELPTVLRGSDYKAKLAELNKSLGVEGNVIFTGGLYGNDLRDAYADADLFVNPSWGENFGLVNLEAAASSLPVIATPVGVAPELLEEHKWLLFKSEADLANILERLLEDEKLRREIGKSLRRKVEEEYTWEKTAESIEGVYRKLCR